MASAAAMDDGCTCKDGPVMMMMNKRLRALKKKYNRIIQIEEAMEQGKAINKEQADVLKSKVQVSILIEEYEKLRQPLLASVKEELAEKEKEWLASKESSSTGEDKEGSNLDGSERISTESENGAVEDAANGGQSSDQADESVEEQLSDVIRLLYFATLFDVKPEDVTSETALVRWHERSSCLSYDFVADDDVSSPLAEQDLDILAKFGSVILSRPPNATVSHKDSLQTCISHSRLWLQNSDIPINNSDMNITYADLREKFNRILSSEYFTMTPELTVTRELQAKTQHLAKPAIEDPEAVVVHDEVVEGHAENGEAITEAPQEIGTAKVEASDPPPAQENGYQRRNRGYRGGGGRGRGSRGYQGGRGRGDRGNYANGRTGGIGQYYDQPHYQQRNYYPGGNGNGNGGARRFRGAYNNGPSSPAAVETQS